MLKEIRANASQGLSPQPAVIFFEIVDGACADGPALKFAYCFYAISQPPEKIAQQSICDGTVAIPGYPARYIGTGVAYRQVLVGEEDAVAREVIESPG